MKDYIKSFEDYLKDIHADSYVGTDDDMPDAFDTWLTDLQVDNYIKYGDTYAKDMYNKGRYDLICEIQPQMDKLSKALGESLEPVVINELTEKN